MSLSASPPFLINDPDHAPFGREWLQGITPARIAVLAAVCAIISVQWTRQGLVRGEYWEAFYAFGYGWARNFVGAVPVFFLVIRTEIATRQWPELRRVAALVAAVLVGAFLFAFIRWGVRYLHNTIGDPANYWEIAVAHVVRGFTTGGVLTALLWFVTRERVAAQSLHRVRLANARIERQIAEARLQLLQAQIEPHFLFNSLASVKRLYERQPARGRELLRNLREYLRIASPRGKPGDARLGDEVGLATAFLAIFQLRMGDRLRVRVDVPPDIRSAVLPPLLLGTLVENAIKHGISPRGTGGTVAVSARRDGSMLEVAVRDDGVGFRSDWGPGIGLANTRARLETLYPGVGVLVLIENPDGGVKAIVRIPFTEHVSGAEAT
jgi:signal transduction histidine kinase